MTKTVDEKFEEIAKRFNIPTLKTRGSDCLDFHTLSAFCIKEMLMEAYTLGYTTGSEAASHKTIYGG